MAEEKEKPKKEEMKNEDKVETKKEEVKPKKDKKIKKDVAVANAHSLRVSPKHSFAVCKVLKGKSPKAGIKRLQDVIEDKRSIPMPSREVGHQKGKGVSGAKFPKNACKEIIKVVKQLEANSVVAGIENPIITIAKADRASAPFRRGGRKGKRTHIHLEARDKSKLMENKK